MRTFIAIEFDPPIRKQLADLQRRLKPQCGRPKWVDPTAMHLTLKFLGEIDPRQCVKVSEALDTLAAECEPFEIAVGGLGTFPPRGSVKVLWVGIEDESGGLQNCHKKCEALLTPIGFPPESRRFSPHLTLARNRNPGDSRAIIAAIEQLGAPNLGSQVVDGVTFYESTLTPRGPIYRAISKHAFSGT
jgi:2'-5' RNA ligase